MAELFSIITITSNFNGFDIEYLYIKDEGDVKVASIDFGNIENLDDSPELAAFAIREVMIQSEYFPSKEHNKKEYKKFVEEYVSNGLMMQLIRLVMLKRKVSRKKKSKWSFSKNI
jgi:hypothetical protein